MKWSTGVVVGIAGLMALISSATPSSAQDKRSGFEAGYQFQREMSEGESVNLPAGFNVAVTYPVNSNVDVVGQFDWSRKSESAFGVDVTMKLATFGGGVRWSSRTNMNVTPFVQVLGGASRASGDASIGGISTGSGSETKGMLQLGGGVSGPISKTVNWLGQFDYRRIFADPGANTIRFVAGVQVKLK
jgi:hypothetical protein